MNIFNRLFFIVILLIPPVISFTQKKNYKDEIKWSDEQRATYEYIENKKVGSKKYLHFNGANYFNTDTLLPYYYRLIPVKSSRVKSVKFEETSFSTLRDIQFEGKDAISSSISLSGTVQTSGGQNY